ncbi:MULTISPECIES: helix-turn-helix transcriptional regulator [Actinocorallia]|uniref:HTH cro/C1-type domain-containing protein n=2 Tax=Actinocorallia TaxID=58108 RepID=A0ABP6H9M7_9ACTN
MAAEPIGVGQHGEHLATEIVRMRGLRGWDQRTLAARITEHGRALSASVLGKVEAKKRRVDVDDLVAIAKAFGVPASRLLGEADYDEPKPERVPGALGLQVDDDIAALGDLEGMAPSLAELARALAREIDSGTLFDSRSLPPLARELREVLTKLAELAAGEDDDDDGLGDLGTPD